MTDRRCSIDGCNRPHYSRDWCKAHYEQWRKIGDPTGSARGTPEERFWPKVNKQPGCWLWTGSHAPAGYGHFKVKGRQVQAHRFAYELLVGPIPDGLQLDHLCRVPACVNPAHLEPVTGVENILRGDGWGAKNARKTHCPHGHPYDEANTYVLPSRPTARYCRACVQERSAQRKVAA